MSLKFVSNFVLRASNFRSEGQLALISLLIIGSITLAFALSAALSSRTEVLKGFRGSQLGGAVGAADACAEEALYRLKLDNNWDGGNITVPDGTCNIAVTDLDSDTRQVIVIGKSGKTSRKIELVVDIVGGAITIVSRKEAAADGFYQSDWSGIADSTAALHTSGNSFDWKKLASADAELDLSNGEVKMDQGLVSWTQTDNTSATSKDAGGIGLCVGGPQNTQQCSFDQDCIIDADGDGDNDSDNQKYYCDPGFDSSGREFANTKVNDYGGNDAGVELEGTYRPTEVFPAFTNNLLNLTTNDRDGVTAGNQPSAPAFKVSSAVTLAAGINTVSVTNGYGAGCADASNGNKLTKCLTDGDEITLVQMYGVNSGRYDMGFIAAGGVGSTSITFNCLNPNNDPAKCSFSYDANAQVLRVPYFTNVTVPANTMLTACPWNGIFISAGQFEASYDGSTLITSATIAIPSGATVDPTAYPTITVSSSGGGYAASFAASGGNSFTSRDFTIKDNACSTGTGGVLFFRSLGNVIVNGLVDMTGKGYAGGLVNVQQGSSFDNLVGSPTASTSPNNSGGGGGNNTGGSGTGAGGGSHASAGSAGTGTAGSGATVTYGSSDFNILTMGSGGGGGGCCGSQGSGGLGGAGGGIIRISAGVIDASGGFIQANGLHGGRDRAGACCDSWGGGGAGGSVYLEGGTLGLNTNRIRAIGGDGSNATTGSGGDGRIRLDINNCYAPSLPDPITPVSNCATSTWVNAESGTYHYAPYTGGEWVDTHSIDFNRTGKTLNNTAVYGNGFASTVGLSYIPSHNGSSTTETFPAFTNNLLNLNTNDRDGNSGNGIQPSAPAFRVSSGVTLTGSGSQTVSITNGYAGCSPLTNCLTAGDEVMIMQMYGTNAGLYDTGLIDAGGVGASSVTFTCISDCSSHTYDANAQVLRVPYFSSVTVPSGQMLTACPWNGIFISAGQFEASYDGSTLITSATIAIPSGATVDPTAYPTITVSSSGGGYAASFAASGGNSFTSRDFTIKDNACSTGTGGVLFFRSLGNVIVNGLVDMTGKGYAGGLVNVQQGSSFDNLVGSPTASTSPNNSGGGGGNNTGGSGTGAGGGSHASAGSAGTGTAGSGATVTYGSSDFNILTMGSGGGGGGCCGSQGSGGLGGAGGGIIRISAGVIDASGGFIQANGLHGGRDRAGACCDSWGGGGAGGSVYLEGGTLGLNTNRIRAIGGDGSNATTGSGGDGRIRLDINNCYAPSLPDPITPVSNCATSTWVNAESGTYHYAPYTGGEWVDTHSIDFNRTGKTLNNTTIYGTGSGSTVGLSYVPSKIGSANTDPALTVTTSTTLNLNTNDRDGGTTGNQPSAAAVQVSNAAAGTPTITVTNVPNGTVDCDPLDYCFKNLNGGDEVIIMQMYGTNAGAYETGFVASTTAATTITLTTNLTRSYDSNAQVIRIPHFASVTVDSTGTLTACRWKENANNCSTNTGGVLFFRSVGNVVVNGTIHMDGKGYAGGVGNVQGNSYQGIPSSDPEGDYFFGGGGNGSSPTSPCFENAPGGGGGSYGGNGSDGAPGSGLRGQGAEHQYPAVADLNLMFFGSGGGGGSSLVCAGDTGAGGTGGVGGGIIRIAADTGSVIDTQVGLIRANGSGGSAGTPAGIGGTGGTGGGGAGGSIYLEAPDIKTALDKIQAIGGNGSSSVIGNGGVGRIRLDYDTCSVGTCTTNPNPDPYSISAMESIPSTDTVALWHMNESSGLVASDSSFSSPSNTGQLGNGDTDIPFEREQFSDTDTGTSGTAPNSTYWTTYGSGTVNVDGNSLYLAGTTTSNTGVNTNGKLTLINDFDIEVDFTNFAISSNGGALTFQVSTVTGAPTPYIVNLERRGGTWGNYILSEENYGIYSNNYIAYAGTSGSLRIARSGSTITTYYKNGSTWTQLGSYSVDTSNMFIRLYSRSDDGDGNPTGRFDNFKPAKTPIWVAGKFGNALQFDGVDDYVSVSDTPFDFERNQNFSVEAWVKTSAASGTIVSKMLAGGTVRGFELGITTGKLAVLLIDTWSNPAIQKYSTTLTINDNNWHHVAMTYGGTSFASGVKLYIDGREDTVTTVPYDTLNISPTNTILNNENLTIGIRGGTILPFNGTIDEVAVWDTVVSPSLIAQHAGRILYTNSGFRNGAYEQTIDTGSTSNLFGEMIFNMEPEAYLPGGTGIKIELAGSNSSSGPWSYTAIWDANNQSAYPACTDNIPTEMKVTCVLGTAFDNLQYLHYRATFSTGTFHISPKLSDIRIRKSTYGEAYPISGTYSQTIDTGATGNDFGMLVMNTEPEGMIPSNVFTEICVASGCDPTHPTLEVAASDCSNGATNPAGGCTTGTWTRCANGAVDSSYPTCNTEIGQHTPFQTVSDCYRDTNFARIECFMGVPFDAKRYLRYRLTLRTENATITPKVSDVRIRKAESDTAPPVLYGIYTSGVHDFGSILVPNKIVWNETIPAPGISAKVQIQIAGCSNITGSVCNDLSGWQFLGPESITGDASNASYFEDGAYGCTNNTGQITCTLSSAFQLSFDEKRYYRYKASLYAEANAIGITGTPVLEDLSIHSLMYETGTFQLISSPFDTSDLASAMKKIQWKEVLPEATTNIQLQIRTAADSAGLSSAQWCGPTTCYAPATVCAAATNQYTDPFGAGAIHSSQSDTIDNQWFQYRACFTNIDPRYTPILKNTHVQYELSDKR